MKLRIALGLLALGWLAGCASPRPTPAGSAAAPPAEDVTVAGAPRMLVDAPAGPGPFPALVLAPGQGYHMRMPAMARTAQAVAARGFVVYRFDWSWWTQAPRGRPTDGLAPELRDFQRVVETVRADPRVRSDAVIAAGKSLGSLVAWQALRADPSLRAAALLTPVCARVLGPATSAPPFDVNYPGITQERRPLLFVLGDADDLCPPNVLLRHAAQAAGPVRVSVVDGDHGFHTPSLPTALQGPALERALQAVGDSVGAFAARALAPPPR